MYIYFWHLQAHTSQQHIRKYKKDNDLPVLTGPRTTTSTAEDKE